MNHAPQRSAPRALPDWSAVPSNSEEDRLHLNRRIAFVGRVALAVSASFYVVDVAIALVFAPDHILHTLADQSTVFHALGAGVSASQWLLCRRGRRSARQLNAIDAVGTPLTLAMYGLMALHAMGAGLSHASTLALITLTILVLRAAIVPSTARRSFAIGVITCVPTLVCTYLVVRRLPATALPSAVLGTIYVANWCAVAVAISTLVSRVVHGLQQRVVEATQLGQYTLEEKIGEGGMGAVYRARHALLRRPTAVKLLLRKRAGSAEMQRFEREVQVTASLTHPNIIGIYDYGHTPEGVFYYAMEYLDGITLQDLVDHDGPQPAARALHVLKQVAGALGEAHAVGLIHRDVKPANLMLCAQGTIADHVKVLDFGLVKQLDPGADVPLSAANILIGTPLYLAPEAIVSPDGVDARSDLYAVGAVGYFLLAGAPPFEGATLLEVCGKHLHVAPERPSARGVVVPSALEELVLACLAKNPGDRPRDAKAVLRELDACEDVPSWSQDEARQWWDTRAANVRAALATRRLREAAGRPTTSGPVTVAVDLEKRQAEDARPAGAETVRAG